MYLPARQIYWKSVGESGSLYTDIERHVIYVIWIKSILPSKIVYTYKHLIIKNVFTSLCLSLREFTKSLPNTFIYESILIKIYVNANIMNTQVFQLIMYDLNYHWRSENITFMFILILTYVLYGQLFVPVFY